jgi:lipoprotein-anchoring transpeptidase ErfK/SrfK
MTSLFLVVGLLFVDKQIVVDLNKMQWTAVQDGQVIKTGEAIGGSERCTDNRRRSCKSPIGTFQIKDKQGWGYRSHKYPLDCADKSKCGARMYMAMHLNTKAGEALHGSDMMVGRNESHGCIRLHKEDALWLSKNFVEIGTTVVILPY